MTGNNPRLKNTTFDQTYSCRAQFSALPLQHISHWCMKETYLYAKCADRIISTLGTLLPNYPSLSKQTFKANFSVVSCPKLPKIWFLENRHQTIASLWPMCTPNWLGH